MLKEPAAHPIELRSQANGKYREHKSFESVRETHNTLQTAGLDSFTLSFIDTLWKRLEQVIHPLDRLPETRFLEMVEVIDGLRGARNELQLACFLFDVEEIRPLHRLILRNRAVLRSKQILHRTLSVWPTDSDA